MPFHYTISEPTRTENLRTMSLEEPQSRRGSFVRAHQPIPPSHLCFYGYPVFHPLLPATLSETALVSFSTISSSSFHSTQRSFLLHLTLHPLSPLPSPTTNSCLLTLSLSQTNRCLKQLSTVATSSSLLLPQADLHRCLKQLSAVATSSSPPLPQADVSLVASSRYCFEFVSKYPSDRSPRYPPLQQTQI